MGAPTISVDIDLIERNARAITRLCSDAGIEVTGVTKGTCGMPQVAHAMIRGGVTGIGESRLENIHRLRAGGLNRPVTLLRIPPLSGAEEIVRSVDVSLNSEISVIRRLAEVAESIGVVHNIILMVDLGDLREGILPDDVLPTVREVRDLPGVALRGVGTNLTCYGGVIPTTENLQQLVDLAHRVEDRFGCAVSTVSGGNSSTLPLLAAGDVPPGITNLRIGEAILLGRETVHRHPWHGTSQRAFLLSGELIERKRKPSVPTGITGQDAFGRTPAFVDKGDRIRGILNIGREDVDVEGLLPEDRRLTIIGASSDHLLLDLTDADEDYPLGTDVAFLPSYSALLAAMTSSYVEKRLLLPPHAPERARREAVMVGSPLADPRHERFMRVGLSRLGYAVNRIEVDTDPDTLAGYMLPGVVPIAAGRDGGRLGLAAAARAMTQFGVIWVDALITTKDLSSLLSRDDPVISQALAPERIVLIGAREIEPEAIAMIKRLRIATFTMEEVSLLSMREVMRLALSRACPGTEGLYLRFAERVDDDGNDGLTNRETHLIMELLAATHTVRFLHISHQWAATSRRAGDPAYGTVRTATTGDDAGEVRPESGRDNLPRFLLSALGKRILGAVQDVVSTAQGVRATQRDEGNDGSHDEAHEGETT